MCCAQHNYCVLQTARQSTFPLGNSAWNVLAAYDLKACQYDVIIIVLRIHNSLLLSLEAQTSCKGGEEQPLTPFLNNLASVQASNKMPWVSNPWRSVTMTSRNFIHYGHSVEYVLHLPDCMLTKYRAMWRYCDTTTLYLWQVLLFLLLGAMSKNLIHTEIGVRYVAQTYSSWRSTQLFCYNNVRQVSKLWSPIITGDCWTKTSQLTKLTPECLETT